MTLPPIDPKQLRQALGLTQREVAEAVGVDISQVSRWERGLQCPDLLPALRYLAALGLPEARFARFVRFWETR